MTSLSIAVLAGYDGLPFALFLIHHKSSNPPPKKMFVEKEVIAALSSQIKNYQKLLRHKKKHSIKIGSGVEMYTETKQIHICKI